MATLESADSTTHSCTASGVIGSILTGVFANKSVGGFSGLLEGNPQQFIANLEGTAIAVVFGFVGTFVLLSVLKAVMNVKVDLKEEDASLDRALHGEETYAF